MGDELKQVEGLLAVQYELQVAKNRWNNFGKYHYFNAEDILNVLKPLLHKYNLQLVISADLIQFGDNTYVKATVTVTDVHGKFVTATGYAREPLVVSGMSPFQITGAATTYATKYALGMMFLIEDSQGVVDPDSLDNSVDSQVVVPKPSKTPVSKPPHVDKPTDEDFEEDVSSYCSTPGCKNSKEHASRPLPENVVTFSKSRHKRVLCYECQQLLKK